MKQFSEIEYCRPDMEKLRGNIQAITERLKLATDYSEAKAAFFEMQKEKEALSTAYTLAEIRNTMNTADAFYEEETAFFNCEMPKLADVEQAFSNAFLNSPFLKEFEAEYGSQLVHIFEAERILNDPRIIEELIEESELSTEYSKLAASCKTEFMGKECNFYGLTSFMEDPDREVRKQAFLAWAALYESISAELDRIFDRLVALRVAMAKKLGYKSYIPLAYLSMNRFDYDEEDVRKFREQVRKVVTPAVEKLYQKQKQELGVETLHYYDEPIKKKGGNAKPIGTPEEMIEKAGAFYDSLGEETSAFFRFMREYSLFDLLTRPGKHLGGYCTILQKYQAPFIFSNFNGTSEDVDVLTHEAGHAFEYYVAARTIPVSQLQEPTAEVAEIHSMTMELFAYSAMDEFFGEKAEDYRYVHMVSTIATIPYLVTVDEFQHRVYENPEMTAKERRQVYREIEKKYMPWRDYDGNEFLEEGGFWMQKQHIFLYPFYYIDYALAQMGAFQLYLRSKENREAALEDYFRLCKAGGSKGYLELLALANLESPFAENSVKKAVEPLVKQVLEG